MKELILDFVAMLFALIFTLVGFAAMLIAVPICIIATPFVSLFLLITGKDDI